MMDLTVKMAAGTLTCRVGAIIIDNDEVLMVKNSGASFFYTVGGRIQFGESAQEAVLREAYEETQVPMEIDRLAFIHENFFNIDGESYHEICWFFLMKPSDQLRKMKHDSFQEEYGEVTYHWLPISELNELHLYPMFFKTELQNLLTEVKHIVTRED